MAPQVLGIGLRTRGRQHRRQIALQHDSEFVAFRRKHDLFDHGPERSSGAGASIGVVKPIAGLDHPIPVSLPHLGVAGPESRPYGCTVRSGQPIEVGSYLSPSLRKG